MQALSVLFIASATAGVAGPMDADRRAATRHDRLAPEAQGQRANPRRDAVAAVTQPPPSAPPAYVVEAIVVDNRGALVEDMRAADFEVIVDGRRRIRVATQRLYRGPGATGLALARQAEPGEMPATAEPSRLVLMVVDQASLLPGDETRARLVAESCLGLLGLNDRVALMSWPAGSGATDFSTDREPVRRALTRLRALRGVTVDAMEEVPNAELGPARETRPGDPEQVERLDDITRGLPDPSREVLSAPAMKTHAAGVLGSLAQVLSFMRTVAGTKIILFISAGLVLDGMDSEMSRVAAMVPAAGARLYALQIPTPAPRFADVGRAGLATLALQAGGNVVTLDNKPVQALQRLGTQLSFSYLLLLAPSAEDVDQSPRSLQVRSRRKNVTIRTARFVAAGGAPIVPEPPAPPLPPAPGGAPDAPWGLPPATAAPRAPARRDPALDAVLARATDYVVAYGRQVSSVVSEEVYEQRVEVPTSFGRTIGEWEKRFGPVSRKLVSDFLLVKIPGAEGWIPFRDVFEVDGTLVRDREDRLMKLFLEAPSKAVDNANRIFEESARYNIGPIYRNLNVPTLPLMFLEPERLEAFTFRKRGEETLDSVRAWVVEYRERGRPTIIKTTAGADVPALGELWLDPVSGRVLKTVLAAGVARVTVTYRPRAETLGLWMPVQMQETYAFPAGRITGKATYSKFRRFQVFTEEQLKIPKL